MRFRMGAPPEEEDFDPEAEGFRAIREPGPVVMQVFALPLCFGALAVVLGAFLVFTPWEPYDPGPLTVVLGFALGFPALICVHELVHAAAHPGSGRSERTIIGAWPSRGLFYAHWEGELGRDRFLWVFVAPTLVLTGGPLLLGWAFQLDWQVLPAIAGLNAMSAAGDYIGIALIWTQIPRNAITRNKGWRTYYRLPEGQDAASRRWWAGVVLVAAPVAYLLLWPVPIDPAPWTPPAAPAAVGVLAPNRGLAKVERLGVGPGPEDVAVDAAGRVVVGLADGRIVRRDDDGSLTTLARTGGRPLGLHHDASGRLLVCDADRGLLRLEGDGTLTSLATGHAGRAFGFTNDLDVGPDGTVYFSDASDRFGVRQVREDVFEHRPHGRLLAYDPSSGSTRLLADGLYFANGVALAADARFVLVVETTRYRVLRHWLAGERAGRTEVFVDNLPGMPDGIARDSDGSFWLAIYTPRVPTLDALLPKPWLRRVVFRLPRRLQPDPIPVGYAVHLSADGTVQRTLQSRGAGAFAPVTSVQPHGDWLYLGTLTAPAVARLARPR